MILLSLKYSVCVETVWQGHYLPPVSVFFLLLFQMKAELLICLFLFAAFFSAFCFQLLLL